MYKIFIFTFCLFVMGCASDRKKARSFMETSKWEMARVYWGKVLKEDPSDEEALKGAELAEFNLTSELSVKVRDSRLSGNIYGALDAGVKLYRLHIKWGRTKTDVDMARFRKKEFMALYPAYVNVLKRSLELNRPLKGSYDLENYRTLFTSLGNGELINIRKNLKKLGQKQCKRYSNQGYSYAHWRLFIKKHCDYYGVNISQQQSRSARVGLDLVGKIKNTSGYAGDHSRKFTNAFITAFRNSLWFNPIGKSITTYKYNGNFNKFMDAETERKYKTYRKDGEDKTFEYTVIWKIQRLSLDSQSSFKLAAREYSVDYHKEEEKRDYSYEGHRQEPYIAARKAKMMRPNIWLGKQSEAYQNRVGQKLKDIWITHTCKRASEESNKYKQAELSIRCSRAKDSRYQNIVDSWYAKNFYVNEEQAKFVLKL